MKRLQLILSIGFLTLGLSLSVGLAYIRYGLDKVSGTFFNDVGKYMPVWLIARRMSAPPSMALRVSVGNYIL